MRIGLGISVVAALSATAALAACAGSAAPSSATPQAAVATSTPSAASTPTATARPNTVQIMTFKFTPTPIEVARGTTVNWVNQDQILHTVTAGTPAQKSGLFDQRMPDVGAQFSYQFKDAGTFPFYCDIHQFMTGQVVVR